MYHYVRDLQQSRFPDIKGLNIDFFEGQVKYLLKHYQFISMEELVYALDTKSKLPPKPVLLSFDDGYTDHYDYVLPVLLQHKIQGSFYPPAKPVLEEKVLDVNKIHFILAAVPDKNLLINELFEQLDIYRDQYQLNSNAEYFGKYGVARRRDTADVMFIKQLLQVVLPEHLRLIICDHLFKKYVASDEAAFSRELYMSVEQLRDMKAKGMHIGSHGYDHYWLGSLTKEKQELEIDRSLEFLQSVGINQDSWTMCYPYGNYNSDTIEILQNKGCKLALTTHTALADIDQQKRFEMSRLDTNELPFSADALTNEWYSKA